jgi:sugar-specific transcriptional regulator TrmB
MYQAVAPTSFFKKLVGDYEDKLQGKKDLALELKQAFDRKYNQETVITNVFDYIEIIQGHSSVHARYVDLVRNTKKEILAFIKSPFAHEYSEKRLDEQVDAADRILKKGVVVRTIYETPSEEESKTLIKLMEIFARKGEEIHIAEQNSMDVGHIPIRTAEGKTAKEKELAVLSGDCRSDFLVNDDITGGCYQGYHRVAMDSAGNFVVCWEDNRHSLTDIYAQRFDATGSPQDTAFRVNDDAAHTYQWDPAIALDNAGNFVIVWADWRNDIYGAWDIYAQTYDAAGNPVGVNFRVNDDAPGNINYRPAVAIDPAGGRFVICWLDYRDPDLNTEIRAQFYENGSPVGTNVQINDPDPFPYNLQWSWQTMVHCNGDTLLFAWQDTRRHKGWDIYAKLIDWSFPGIEEVGHDVARHGLRAYPSPFRNCITITGTDDALEIYDICGRLVGRVTTGIWNGKDLNGREVKSGVYFLRAKSSDYEVLKVIKLR